MATTQPSAGSRIDTLARRPWTLVVSLVAMLVIAVAAAVASAGVAAGSASAATTVDGAEAKFFSLLNQDRAQEGLAPLASDPALVTIARGWSKHMMDVHLRTGDPVIKPG